MLNATAVRPNLVTSLVILASQVTDLPLLYTALLPGSIGHTIQPNQDSIDRITHLLTETGATKLAIVAHGQPGAIQIGNGVIDRAMLETRSGLLQEWGVNEIALYSCEVGADKEFVRRFGELTGAKIAATTEKVGAGNWELDGGMELLEVGYLADYSGTLTTFNGTVGDDIANAFSLTIAGFTGGTVANLTDATGDTFVGLDGADYVQAGNANDFIYGGNGGDTLFGSGGLDIIFGQAGDDFLYGEAGNDYLFGGTGIDIINGDLGSDEIYGEDGNDTIYGDEDDDFIFGQAGNDTLNGNAGNDYLVGGLDIDTINGGLGSDQIYGEDGNDLLNGNEDNDFIFGQAGNDTLNGNAGNDYLVGGEGADQLFGGDGSDQLNGENGDDYLVGGNNDDFLYGNDGNDTIFAGDGNDVLDGGIGDDVLFGGPGGDVLFGGDGNDSLTGEFENDNPAGVDYLFGGDGNDFLYGNTGADFLIGGAGSDTFYYAAMTDAGDTITDFNPLMGGDKLNLTNLFNPTLGLGHSVGAVNSSYLQFVQSGVNTLCLVDQNGAVGGINFITMATLNNVMASSMSTTTGTGNVFV
jgi:Ca2+-binding RTX toxin-like protein